MSGDERPGDADRVGLLQDLWAHPWGRTLLIAITVASVSWAVRETAVITQPVAGALRTVLVPLGIGFVIAYVLTPLVDVMQRWGMKRRIATPLLFLLLSVVTVLAISLGMPSMLRQGSELLTRFFSDVAYYDANANRRFDKGEIVVTRAEDDDGIFFFEDRDGDGRHDPDERSFPFNAVDRSGHPIIRQEPSLVARGMRWLETTQQRVEIMLDTPPEQRSLQFLAFYLEHTADSRQALQASIARILRGEDPDASVPPEAEVPNWNPEWPWPHEQPLEEVLAQRDESDRRGWMIELVAKGQVLAEQHRELLAAWGHIRQGLPDGGELVEDLRATVAARPSPQRLDRARSHLDTLRAAEGAAERELLYALYGHEARGGLWQRTLDQVRSIAVTKADAIGDLAGQGAEAALSNVGGIMQFGLDVILVPIYAFFLTLVMPQMRSTLARYAPQRGRERLLRITYDIERVVAAFFRGRLIVCLLCAVLCALGFMILDVPYALLFGLLIGLATAIPLSGLLFLVPAVLLVLAGGGEGVLLRSSLVVLVYTVIQTLEATVFTPTIMGREVELHPVVLIAALVFLGNLMGVLGLLLAVPIAATIRILLREFALDRLRHWAGVPESGSLERPAAEQRPDRPPDGAAADD